MYPLCQIFVALHSHASIALNSVTGDLSSFALATVGVSPTVIIASSNTVSKYYERFMRPHIGLGSRIARFIQVRSLDAGVMSSHNLLSQLATVGPTAELSLDKLRLMCISHRSGDTTENCLNYEQLTDLRIFTGARIVYALTAPGVAGAITQTNVFDYRRFSGNSHFGPPLSSVEVVLTDVDEDNEKPTAGKVRTKKKKKKKERKKERRRCGQVIALMRQDASQRGLQQHTIYDWQGTCGRK